MKTLLMADIHGNKDVVQALYEFSDFKLDLVLIGGDVIESSSSRNVDGSLQPRKGMLNDLRDALFQLNCPVLVTPGNHDKYDFKCWNYMNIRAVIDEMVEMSGLKIYMTPWSTPFFNWAWMRPDSEANYKIPVGTDIVVSHGPCYGLLDEGTDPETGVSCHTGSKALLDAIQASGASRVFTGHIHGNLKYRGTVRNGIIFQNISVLDEDYEFKKSFLVLDL